MPERIRFESVEVKREPPTDRRPQTNPPTGRPVSDPVPVTVPARNGRPGMKIIYDRPVIAPPSWFIRKMRSIDLYSDGDGDSLTFAARCSPIAELYRAALTADRDPIVATSSHTRIFVTNYLDTSDTIPDELPDPRYGGLETMYCGASREVLDLPENDWGPGLLDWLHTRLTNLARARSWDQAPLERARAAVVAANFEFRMESPRRLASTREFRAVVGLEIEWYGTRLLALELTNRQGVVVGRTTATLQPFFCDLPDFVEIKRRMRWTEDQTAVAHNGGPQDLSPPLIKITATVGEFQEVDALAEFRAHSTELRRVNPSYFTGPPVDKSRKVQFPGRRPRQGQSASSPGGWLPVLWSDVHSNGIGEAR